MKHLLFILLISKIILIFGQYDDSMDHIIDNIYLGDVFAARNETYLKIHNISIVINCAMEHKSEYKDIKALELELLDFYEIKLFPKFDFVYKIIKQYNKTNIFIHCMGGVSRSASLVLFYIMKEKKWNYDISLNYARSKRPTVNPNESFANQLKEYYNKYIK